MNGLRRWLRRAPKTLTSVEAYQLWAAAYPPHAHNPLMELEQRAMLDVMPPLSGRVVLDLACGTGRYMRIVEQAGAARVIGVDNSAAMLEGNAQRGRVLGSMSAVPLASESVDVVVCGLAVGHFPDLSAVLNEIGRVLKPGGAALISDVHPFAAHSGGQRTFTGTDRRTYAVEHYVHWYEDYVHAARDARLRIDAAAEPRYGGSPVVIVYRMIKTG